MKVFLISYDLLKPGQNYTNLFNAIKSIANGWCHALESTWLIGYAGSAREIRDALKAHIDSNDRLLVVRLQGDWASYNLRDVSVEWLQNHVRLPAAV